jgi:ankyrin repeat protein
MTGFHDGAAESALQFFAAVKAGDTATVRLLLDEEPTLLAAVSPSGVRAPLAALASGYNVLADELAARSGELDVHEASAFDDSGRLRTLLLANPGAVNDWSLDGWQPLHVAAYYGRVEAVRQLLDANAPVFDPSRNGYRATALHCAAAGSHAEIVWLLIASDADVNVRQAGGRTALHLAAANGDVESVRALLSAQAQRDLADENGQTARDLASEQDIVDLLA